MRTAKCSKCGTRIVVEDDVSRFSCTNCQTILRLKPKAAGAGSAPKPSPVQRPVAAPPAPPPTPAAPRAEWHFSNGSGASSGPVTEQQLAALVKSGGANAATQVWKAGMADWLPLRDTGLANLLPRPAAAPQMNVEPEPPPLRFREPAPGPAPAAPRLDVNAFREPRERSERERARTAAPNWFIVCGGAAVGLGFFLPWVGMGPVKVSAMDVINLALEAGAWDLSLSLIVCVPILGVAAAVIEGVSKGALRVWAGAAGAASLLCLVIVIWGMLSEMKGAPRDAGFLKYFLHLGTIFTIGGCLTVLIACIATMQPRGQRGYRRPGRQSRIVR